MMMRKLFRITLGVNILDPSVPDHHVVEEGDGKIELLMPIVLALL